MNLRELTKRYGRGIGLSINAVRSRGLWRAWNGRVDGS